LENQNSFFGKKKKKQSLRFYKNKKKQKINNEEITLIEKERKSPVYAVVVPFDDVYFL
jgi:hypothetical protein